MPEPMAPAKQRTSRSGLPAGPAYDVFVSYSPEDRRWVASELLPRLRDRDLRFVIDYQNFEIGVPVLENIENAFRCSRYTVAVITSAWLANRWSKHQRMVVLSADVTDGKHRFLPLKLEPCQLPADLDPFTCADFTDSARFGEEWDRLLDQLTRADSSSGTAGVAASVKRAFRSLEGMLHDPEVHDEVVKYQSVFLDVNEKILVLSEHKYLHDLLHEIQVRCYKPILVAEPGYPRVETRLNLAEYDAQLKIYTDRLDDVARSKSFTTAQVQWIQKLLQAHEELDAAVGQANRDRLTSAINLLKGVVDREPPKINARLTAQARGLSLAALSGAMAAISTKLDRPDLDPAKVQDFKAGADDLHELHQRLLALIEQHDSWQNVDDLLRITETQLSSSEEDLSGLEQSWTELKELAKPLIGDPTAPILPQLHTEAGKLDKALASREPFKALQAFRCFRGLAAQLFYDVDKALLALCGDLCRIGRPLALVLKVISHA